MTIKRIGDEADDVDGETILAAKRLVSDFLIERGASINTAASFAVTFLVDVVLKAERHVGKECDVDGMLDRLRLLIEEARRAESAEH